GVAQDRARHGARPRERPGGARPERGPPEL
ncbi:MAG: hypothetical protein AVDCRST_MAG35-222, partial [uncultured Quadrisphaera sp.]